MFKQRPQHTGRDFLFAGGVKCWENDKKIMLRTREEYDIFKRKPEQYL